MCSECGMTPCPPACPGYTGSGGRECVICGLPVIWGDRYYRRGSECVCRDCAGNMDTEDLLNLLCLDSVEEILLEFGFSTSNE